MLSDDILRRIRTSLAEAFGQRLQKVILYGSEAREQAEPDSDIDLLVLLDGPIDDHDDSWACINCLYPLVLELERPLHAKPVDVNVYDAQEWPLYQNVKQEGIAV